MRRSELHHKTTSARQFYNENTDEAEANLKPSQNLHHRFDSGSGGPHMDRRLVVVFVEIVKYRIIQLDGNGFRFSHDQSNGPFEALMNGE